MPRPLPRTPTRANQYISSEAAFVSKPARGWLHPDQAITKEGINYAVRYIGCLQVHTSMKSLDFETRSQVGKECITRVCEAAGLKTQDKKRKVDKRVTRAISDGPIMEHAGSNVQLNISSTGLVLSMLESGKAIASHDMPRISFACGGDTDTLDFVAYVAKDLKDWRACYVLECGGGLAQDVIITLGQAFDLRFQQFLTCPPPDRDYYNDMPGKIPPEAGPPPVPPLPATREACSSVSNLIDLNCEVQAPLPTPRREPDYANDVRDVFDMQPFGTMMRVELQKEPWFHGPVSRQHAEGLLLKDGDFLVRESQGSWGQYVLTGMQGGIKKHLLLVDPEGVVRTKDRMFESVSHLINYHCQNELPIISAESALILRNPVHRPA